MQATMRTTVSARALNEMIQTHIDSRLLGTYVWHTGVYLHPVDATGCNWNVAINCKEDVPSCGAIISGYLDDLRHRFAVAEDDVDVLPAYESDRVRELETPPSTFAGLLRAQGDRAQAAFRVAEVTGDDAITGLAAPR